MKTKYQTSKRLFDIAFSLFLIILLSPIFLICWLLAVLFNGFPVFYHGLRLGKDKHHFYIHKFRTMHLEQRHNQSQITGFNDSRITSLGRIFRKLKLDELPQLWNVLKGDMSIVGPRPESVLYVNEFRGPFQQVLALKPGITGMASVQFSNEEALFKGVKDVDHYYRTVVLPKKLSLELYYLERMSLFLDLKIIIFTLFRLVKKPNKEQLER